jgi:hypothetical protein
MIDIEVLGAVTALGLAASAGLNTTLPLVIAGVLARLGMLDLAEPYDALASLPVLGALVLAAALEFVGDKVPAVDSAVQVVQAPLAAVAGAILFASQISEGSVLSPELGMALGFLTAGTVHGARMAARPLITALTGGVGNPAVSTAEDAYSVSLAGTAALAPLLGLLLLLALAAAMVVVSVWAVRRGMRLTRLLRGR